MAGRRPLSQIEERQLLRVVRKLNSRDRALITIQWFTGFRIREVLSLTVGSVFRNGAIATQIGVTPRHLKGQRGRTRWVPVLPEIHRALRFHLWWLKNKFELTPDLPLFPSRQLDARGHLRPLAHSATHDLVKACFARAGLHDDSRLGTHSLRKTFAKKCYLNSGHDLLVVKAALHHRSVHTTEKYLEVNADEVQAAIAVGDFTWGGSGGRSGREEWGSAAPLSRRRRRVGRLAA